MKFIAHNNKFLCTRSIPVNERVEFPLQFNNILRSNRLLSNQIYKMNIARKQRLF